MNSDRETEHERAALRIFESAIDRDEAERIAYVEESCGGDHSILQRVGRLLRAFEAGDAAGFLDAEPPPFEDPDSGSIRTRGSTRSEEAAETHEILGSIIPPRPEFIEAFRDAEPGLDASVTPSFAPIGGAEGDSQEPRYSNPVEIARGGMGVVFRVWDEVLRRRLAMKVSRVGTVSSSSASGASSRSLATARFLEEAQVTGQLDHPGVVPLHDVGVDAGGRAFFTMQLVEGRSLAEVFELSRNGGEGWSSTRVFSVLIRVCETLAYAHSKGVIHRDVKPSNIMVGRYGETYVMDWGLAKVIGRRDLYDLRVDDDLALDGSVRTDRSEEELSLLATVDGTVVGTPSFMPPEQASGEREGLDERSDVYAVGAMLYAFLAGYFPYADETGTRSPRRIVEAVRAGPPAPILERALEGSAPELISICEKAMARERSSRYQSMDALAEDLRALVETRAVQAHATGAFVEFRKWVARNRLSAVSLAAAGLALVAGLVVALVLLRDVTTKEKAVQDALGSLEIESEALGVALGETSRALDDRSEALRRAESMRLCAESAAILPVDPGQAILRAMEAHRLFEGPRSRDVLLAALGELREEKTLVGHFYGVWGLAFHPDSKFAVTGARDFTVRVWNLETGKEALRLTGHRGGINGVAYHPSGDQFVSWAWDGTVRVWEHETGRVLKVFRHANVVTHVDFDRRGRHVLTTSFGGKARIWDFEEERVAQDLAGHGDGKIHWGEFSPDDRLVVTACEDGVARVFDVKTGKLVHAFDKHSAAIHRASFDHEGRRIVTASADDTARIWDASSGEQLQILEGHERWVRSAEFSPDGRLVLTASADGTAKIWDAMSGEARRVLDRHRGAIRSARFSYDGTRALTTSEDRTVRIWEAETGRELLVLRGHQREVVDARFAPSGNQVVSISRDHTARLWRADTTDEVAEIRSPGWDSAIAFDEANGRVVVVGSGANATLRDVSTGELLFRFEGLEGGVRAAAFHPDANIVATSSFDGLAQIWDVSAKKRLHLLRGHRWNVASLAFNSDGSRLATAAIDATARIWDTATGESIFELEGHSKDIEAIAFSDDDSKIATGSHDETLRVWDAKTGKPLLELADGQGYYYLLRFDPTGRFIVGASLLNVVLIWDTQTRSLVTRLGVDTPRAHAIVFDAAATRMVTLHVDGRAHVWNLRTGQRHASVRSSRSRFRSAKFNADATVLETETLAGTKEDWPLEPFKVAERRVPRIPTPYDLDRIDIDGVVKTQTDAARRALWTAWQLSGAVATAKAALDKHSDNRRAIFGNARSLRVLLTAAVRSLELEKEEGAEQKSIAERLLAQYDPAVIAGALECIERAAELPGPPSDIRHSSETMRKVLGGIPWTVTSVDASLDEVDSELLVPADAEWEFARAVDVGPVGGKGAARRVVSSLSEVEWIRPDWEPAGWTRTRLPIGFGVSLRLGTELEGMRGSHDSVYLRRVLKIDDLSRWRRFRIELLHDDSFVVFINGKELVRRNAGAAGGPIGDALESTGRVTKAPLYREYPIPLELLRSGENVISVQLMNHDIDDEDLYLSFLVEGVRVPSMERDRVLLERLRALGQHAALERPRMYLSARRLQREGRFAEAREVFTSLYDRRPDDSTVALRIVECLRAEGQRSKADERLRDLLRDAPGSNGTEREIFEVYPWRLLRVPDQGIVKYFRAARWARRGRELADVSDLSSRAMVAIANHRLGLHSDALITLYLCHSAKVVSSSGLSTARILAFLSMAHGALGQKELALKRAENLFKSDSTEGWGGSPYVLEAARKAGFDVEKRPFSER